MQDTVWGIFGVHAAYYVTAESYFWAHHTSLDTLAERQGHCFLPVYHCFLPPGRDATITPDFGVIVASRPDFSDIRHSVLETYLRQMEKETAPVPLLESTPLF